MPVSGTTTVAAADLLQAMIEKVRPVLQQLYEETDRLAKLIGKANVEQISDKLYRIPLLLFAGGTFQKFDADGGTLGTGSGMLVDKMTAGYIYSNYAITITRRTKDTTASPGQAVVNAFQFQLSKSMVELGCWDDVILHTAGDGVLTNKASATGSWSGGTYYTFAGTTSSGLGPEATVDPDNLGVNRLREGMTVHVYDAALANNKQNSSANGYPFVIHHINYSTKTVYLTGTVASAASTDVLAVPGMFAQATSNSPAYGASSWPLSGDTFRHGIYYANETNTSLYYLGIQRSALPQLAPTVRTVNGSITHNDVLLVQDQMRQRRDEAVFQGMIGIAHMSQRAQFFAIGITLSEWFRGPKDEMIDLMPANTGLEKVFQAGGITHYLSKRQYRDRIDYINPKLWGRAQLFDARPYESGGRTVFEGRSSTGMVKAEEQMFIEQAFDNVCFDPGAQAIINNATVPPGY